MNRANHRSSRHFDCISRKQRILTTFPLQLVFFTLVILTFLSFVLTIILFLNTALDLTGIAIPYR